MVAKRMAASVEPITRQVSGSAGTARVRNDVVLAELALAPWYRTGVAIPVLSFGLGVLHLDARGEPRA